MADRGEVNRTDQSEWGWIPSRRYGPFVFGASLAEVPHLGPEVNRVDMGGGEISTTHDTDLVGVSLSFWTGRLVGVGSEGSFVLNDTELIGTHLNEIRGLFSEEPVIKNYDPLITVVFDELSLVLYLDMAWIVTSVYVSVDPDRLNGEAA